MNYLKIDTDEPLVQFINDYVEQKLDSIERSVFEEYLSANAEIAKFVRQSQKGKKVLKNAYQIQAAPDFEEKLAERIKQEKEGKSHSEYCRSC